MSITKYTLKPFRKFVLILVIFTFSQHILLSQNNATQKIIEGAYNLFENNKSTQEIFELTPKVKWDTTKTGDRYTITLFTILKNEWRGVSFQNLVFREIEENKVLVTGTVSGRQPTECEDVTTKFQHIWTLEEGKIINLTE